MGGTIEGNRTAHRARGAPVQPGNTAPVKFYMPPFRAAATSFAVQASTAPVHAKDEIEGVIAAQARNPGGGLIVMPDLFNTINRDLIFALAARSASRRSISLALWWNQAA